MKKVFFISAALIVCTSFSFAADFESASFDLYSYDSLSPMAVDTSDVGIMPLAATEWDTSDSKMLADIRNAMVAGYTGGTSSSILGLLRTIAQNVEPSSFDSDSASELTNINGKINLVNVTLNAINSVLQSNLDYLPNLVNLQSMNNNLDYIQEDIVSLLGDVTSFYTLFDNSFGPSSSYPVRVGSSLSHTIQWLESWAGVSQNLTLDSLAPWDDSRYTLYHYIRNLSDTLATEDDKLLAEAQKENREEIEDSFLNGSSGSTSLGVGDFQNLNSVGSEVTDLFSLGGTASVDGFVSGFSDAESVGSGWFSAATQSQLDTVPTSFALGDPYNMAGWESNYEWVLGGDFE